MKEIMKEIKVKAEKRGLSMEIDREQFAMALKTWRLRQNLTQEEVGHRWGMSRYTILRLEKAHQVNWTTAYRVFAKLSEELKNEKETPW